MDQGWNEDDLLTPTAADLESAYGSRIPLGFGCWRQEDPRQDREVLDGRSAADER